jgi:aminoglycoside phosphotransferase (APT) family kinase protein
VRATKLTLTAGVTGDPVDRTKDNTGVKEVADRLRFDVGALERWMGENVEGFAGPLRVSQFKGGQSNPTYRLDTPSGPAFVLRRKPPGKLLPGAHAVDREARVMSALGRQHFPVPRVHGLCEDENVIGTPFFVMDLVEGRIVWEASFPGLAPIDRAAHFDAMNATIAQLHGLEPEAIGLGDYGRATGFVERQVARWSKQYENDVEAGRLSAMDRLVDWLKDNLPPDSGDSRVVHGDFRCDNMIFAPVEARVAAVLDWELSTLGDPVADFVYHLMMYRMPAGMFTGLNGLDFAELGIPAEEEYVAAYCRRTGRNSLPNLDYLIVFVIFRLAAICHGIRGRLARGSASSAHAEATAALTGPLADLALAQLKAARL